MDEDNELLDHGRHEDAVLVIGCDKGLYGLYIGWYLVGAGAMVQVAETYQPWN